MSKITLENISFTYSPGTPFEKKALDGINLNIKNGSITGIIGHTGSGKSTLVRLLNGLARPSEGRVLLDGEDIWAKPKEISKIRFRVGLVMQYPEYQLFEETIEQDIAFGPKNMKLSAEEISERVRHAAKFVSLDESYFPRSPFELSGGEKRRAAIAGVMAMYPDVLVLDEPAAGLDPMGRKSLLDGICEYRANTGATIVIVSHSMEDMAQYCDDIIVMADGKIPMQGSCHDVFSRSEELLSMGLDIPQITQLMIMLKNNGIKSDCAIYTVDDAEKSILKLLENIK